MILLNILLLLLRMNHISEKHNIIIPVQKSIVCPITGKEENSFEFKQANKEIYTLLKDTEQDRREFL